MRTRFYQASSRSTKRTQGIQRTRRIRLSKEARAAASARQREAALRYKNDITDAWKNIDQATEDLAVTHHKSLRRVQAELHMGRNMARTKRHKTSAWNAFCWKKRQDKENASDDDGPNPQGKEVLQHLVRDYRPEYDKLTSQEQAELIREFDEYKSAKATGFRISMRARVNDVTKTLQAVENELENLKSRTGIETLLFVTRGSTDMAIKPVVFATQGVETFMEGAMKIDTQDFLSKLEGFAIQGVVGAAKNHQQRVSAIRADIRRDILDGLKHVTEDPDARMHWKNYWRNVVKKYRVIIEGWPANIPFASLSDVSVPLPDLETLLRQWQSGKIYWRELTASEFKKLNKERDDKLESGEIQPPAPRRPRSDRGKKRPRSRNNADDEDDNQRKRKQRKKRSRAIIRSDEDDSDNERPPQPHDSDSDSRRTPPPQDD